MWCKKQKETCHRSVRNTRKFSSIEREKNWTFLTNHNSFLSFSFSLSLSLFSLLMNIDILIVTSTPSFLTRQSFEVVFFSSSILSSNQILSSEWEDLQQYIILIKIYKSFQTCSHIDIFIQSIEQWRSHIYIYSF